ncbi:MAG TPA: zinc metallopeptidase [Longimicrobiales bacterium]|nr:zinc metallopeptidase [Trueperaceae bacterium]HKJ93429.1 zinc metallopeptidase [Longimicrobiales bacterium]
MIFGYYGGYMLIGLVAFVASLAIQGWLKSTYGTWMKRANTAGLSGADVARAILQANGISDVQVVAVQGQLTDHYDPAKKVVNLSADNFRSASVAGMAVAAHETGHAIQHARAFAPLAWRSAILPAANIGSQFGPMLAVFGLFLGAAGRPLLMGGVILFGAAVVFHLVTLPVEFDASRRAMVQLKKLGLVTAQDQTGARKVLTAAAMTYVAAAATAIAYLLYFLGAARR